MKTAFIGGTFNPLHIGHLYLAEELRCQFGYERILFIPTHIPSHKDYSVSVSPQQRLDMLEVVLSKNNLLTEPCEIIRGGISYTIDTVHFLKKKYTISGKLGMVIGDDLVPGLSSWKKWDDLEKEIDLIIAHRKKSECVPYTGEHYYLDNLILPISSRNIRQRIKNGKAFRYLVPEPVYLYIKKYNLYHFDVHCE